ncbi:hypothetical protein [Arthrobacter sp. Leaf137]|uniref:hypothetical protein n=1 Tax=Arthrobacter sp. Leaf137 TaxID=1736271 RepID=UPI0006FB190B|nr:hypothetical protein [Arthrobacter sp. Leaf137]KQQ85116.1 hypothetical protein ASF64_02995 [Arthrobacter sp. Leaf137]
MPSDPDTLSFALTYGGTLTVALLMLIGQLAAVSILLILAGTVAFVAHSVKAIARSIKRPDRTQA